MNAQFDFGALPTGCHRKPCPICQKGPSDAALSITVDSNGAVWNCFRCGWSGHSKYGATQTSVRAVSPRARISQMHETLSPNGREIWESCIPIGGDALAYLKARHCMIPPSDGDLRCHPRLRHPSGQHIGSALVGLITDALDRIPMSLHMTWVHADGSKAAITSPRMLLKGHRKSGGVIRLWPDEAVTQGLGIAEGIETALSVAHGFTPMWSCIDAGNLGGFPLLDVESLVIFADNDGAGISAARKTASRWKLAGRSVRFLSPPESGDDFNDLLNKGAA